MLAIRRWWTGAGNPPRRAVQSRLPDDQYQVVRIRAPTAQKDPCLLYDSVENAPGLNDNRIETNT